MPASTPRGRAKPRASAWRSGSWDPGVTRCGGVLDVPAVGADVHVLVRNEVRVVHALDEPGGRVLVRLAEVAHLEARERRDAATAGEPRWLLLRVHEDPVDALLAAVDGERRHERDALERAVEPEEVLLALEEPVVVAIERGRASDRRLLPVERIETGALEGVLEEIGEGVAVGVAVEAIGPEAELDLVRQPVHVAVRGRSR